MSSNDANYKNLIIANLFLFLLFPPYLFASSPNVQDEIGIAITLNKQGNLYSDQGRYAEAEPFYKRSLVIREKILGPHHIDVSLSLNNLAYSYENQGRYAEAELLYKRSLAILE